jgi:rod shape determining protein RodA
MMIALFILSLLLEPLTLLILLVAGCALGAGAQARSVRATAIYLAAVALAASGIYWLCRIIDGVGIGAYYSLLIAALLSIIPVAGYAYRARVMAVLRYAAMLCASVVFVFSVDYLFDNVMQTHQQKRVLDLLGIESDPAEWGYNVNQSKIAIGSGGLLGKGYMRGTQTRFDFVPEQSTDFIFCTVGEEWGFAGSVVVLALFCVLILRLMRMGERQHEAFGRVYCYCVASVFLFHVVVNIGMTIGLMPVIGIPLPLFSYGGSSLMAFTLLFFAAVKLDSQKREVAEYSF